MRYEMVLFDFDGTIADSEEGMREALNSIADEFGFEKITPDEFPRLRTLSLRAFVTERLGIPLWRLRKLWRLERKAKREFEKHSSDLRVFDGMSDVFHALKSAGVVVGVVSSASPDVIERTLREHVLTADLVHAGVSTLGKARALRSLLRARRADKEKVLYVGDELRDVRACKKAGVAMLGVSWGLNDAETLRAAGVRVASTPRELFSMLSV